MLIVEIIIQKFLFMMSFTIFMKTISICKTNFLWNYILFKWHFCILLVEGTEILQSLFILLRFDKSTIHKEGDIKHWSYGKIVGVTQIGWIWCTAWFSKFIFKGNFCRKKYRLIFQNSGNFGKTGSGFNLDPWDLHLLNFSCSVHETCVRLAQHAHWWLWQGACIMRILHGLCTCY